ncbi:MAG: glycosyltransferase [Candidatus Hydrogenedentes bacterium]|nr:glycosyltransferase [Candidatus Hydrogenedentota bacterium]
MRKDSKDTGSLVPDDESLLLVVPVSLRLSGGKTFLEIQACNGVERWAESFSSVVFAAPVIPEDMAAKEVSTVWRDVDELNCRGRSEFIPLPWAYRYRDFAAAFGRTRKVLRALVERTRYLHLSLSGFAGDWAAVAALEARKLGRAYACHTDRVEFSVQLAMEPRPSFKRLLRAYAQYPLIKYYQRHVIKTCAVGLWHGYDCYRVYSKMCSNNFLVHDIHTKKADYVGWDAVENKAARVLYEKPLRVVYTGRASGMKGPLDWVRSIAYARDYGADFTAAWVGDGPLLEDMKRLAHKLGLDGIVSFPGFVEERKQLLEYLRNAHVLVFTHLTPESPRCLIESFVSGTPIVGYENAYAQDLIEGYGGGAFVKLRDAAGLGRLITELDRDRPRVAELIREAGKNGARWNDEEVFRHRSDLLKQNLP